MTIEQIIQQHHDEPVGKSIKPVATSLSHTSVFVATEAPASSQPHKVKLEKLRLKVDTDNRGRLWAYAYTSEAQLLQSFPQGSGFAELSFVDLFTIIDRDLRFAGIYLNSGSDTFYPIPRELFQHVRQVLPPTDG